MNSINELIKDKPKLAERVSRGLTRELERQRAAGKEFISDTDVDKLVDEVIKEELGDNWQEDYSNQK